MQIIHCDICGKRMRQKDPEALYAGRCNSYAGDLGRLTVGMDV